MKTIKVEQHRQGLVLVRGAENELLSESDLVTLSWEIETALDQIAEFGSQESVLAELYLEDAIKIVSESQIIFPKDDMIPSDNLPGICLAIRSGDTVPAGVKVCSKENLCTNENSSCSEDSLGVEVDVFVQTQESQLLLTRLHYLLQKQVQEEDWFSPSPVYRLFRSIFVDAGKANEAQRVFELALIRGLRVEPLG